MLNETNLQLIFDLLTKILIFFERPTVQLQLALIILTFSLALLLSNTTKFFISKIQLLLKLRRLNKNNVIVINYLLFPVFALFLLILLNNFMNSQGFINGLVIRITTLTLIFTLYRLFLSISYIIFHKTTVKHYHHHFFIPLVFFFIIFQLLNELTDIQQLANVVLAKFFDGVITIGGLLQATIGLYLWIYALSGIQDIAYRILKNKTTIPPGILEGSLSLIRYFLIGLGILVALTNLGLNTTTIAAITGGLSIGIGFGSKEILSNFISGILLLFEGALKPGDVIRLDDEIATVKKLSIRATTVLTPNNVEKFVPNQTFLTSSVITYTGSNSVIRILIPIGVSYNSNPEQIIALLIQAGQAHPHVLNDPPPSVYFTAFGESSLDFQLAVWLDNPIISKLVISELNLAIWKIFNEHNIEIPFPQRVVHIRN
ncbi:MAG: mechanosensitive ion channel domain-containing protein [Phormidium sp.]